MERRKVVALVALVAVLVAAGMYLMLLSEDKGGRVARSGGGAAGGVSGEGASGQAAGGEAGGEGPGGGEQAGWPKERGAKGAADKAGGDEAGRGAREAGGGGTAAAGAGRTAGSAEGGSGTAGQEQDVEAGAESAGLAALEGRVVDNRGLPVSAAAVTARRGGAGGVHGASSAADGRFSFDGLEPGIYLLEAEKDGTKGVAGPVPAKGEDAPFVHIVLGADAYLAGRVLDQETSGPVPGIQVLALDLQRGHKASGFSAADGGYRVDVPSPGSYLVFAEKSESYLGSSGRTQVEVGQGEHKEGIDLFVQRGISLEGVVLAGDKPVPDATVMLVDLLNDQGGDKGQTVSDQQGEFVFAAQKPGGRYVARAVHPDFGFGESKPVLTGPGGAQGRLEVRLVPGQAVGGRLLTDAGVGVAGIEVWLLRENEQPWRPMPGTRTVSAADGSFEMKNIPAGRYQFVVVTAETTRLVTESIEVVKGKETPRLDISLGKGVEGFIEGRVTSPEGEALPAVEILAWASTVHIVAAADTTADGKYRIDGLGPAQVYTVWARGYRLGRVRKNLENVPVNSSGVDFVLAKASGLSGHVVDADTKEPVTRFHVGGNMVDKDFDSPDGSFALSEIQMLVEPLRFTAPGYLPADYPVTGMQEGEVKQGVVVEMKTGALIEGMVRDEVTLSPVAGARVKLLIGKGVHLGDLAREWSWGLADPFTDAQGRFFIHGQPEGQVNSLIIWHPSYAALPVLSTPAHKLDLLLSQGANLTVHVTKGGQPAAGGTWLNAWLQQPDPAVTVKAGGSVEAGKVRLEKLPPGTYVLEVMEPGGGWRENLATVTLKKGDDLEVSVDLDPSGGMR